MINKYKTALNYNSICFNDPAEKSSNMGSYHKRFSGNITVEAAFILPMVMFVIMAIIYLTFYLYDGCRIQGIIDKTIHKAGLSVKHETEFVSGNILYEKISERGVFYLAFGSTDKEEQQILEYLEQELATGLFLTNIKSIKVDYNKFKIQVSVLTDVKLTIIGFSELFHNLKGRTYIADITVHDPVETLRRTEVILDTSTKIKGVNELKGKIEKFLKPD